MSENELNQLANMDRIRNLRGLPAIDPTRIEDNGIPPARGAFEDVEDDFPAISNFPDPEPSPLVNLGAAAPVSSTPEPPNIPGADLFVMGSLAIYKGQRIDGLSDEDQASIATIILKAQAKRIEDQLCEILRAKHAPIVEGQIKVAEGLGPFAPPEKKKRGRPRKNPVV